MLRDPIRIAVLVDGLTSRYQLRLFNGARRAAHRRGAQLIGFQGAFFRRVESEQPRFDASFLYDLAVPEAVDGIIPVSTVLATTIGVAAIAELCRRHGLPCVSVGQIDGLPYVGPEPGHGLRSLVRHLVLDHGRRKIGFVRGNPSNPESGERESTVVQTLRELGVPVREELFVQGNFLEASGQSAVRTLFDERRLKLSDIEALVCANDQMAGGAALELTRRGIRLPEDIAIVGFDDDDHARSTNPPLTTVAQPIEDIGERAVELLFDCLEGRSIATATLLATQPVFRRSCGCPWAGASAQSRTVESPSTTRSSSVSASLARLMREEEHVRVEHLPAFPGDERAAPLLARAVLGVSEEQALGAFEDFRNTLLESTSRGADPLRWEDLLVPLRAELEAPASPTASALRSVERIGKLRALIHEVGARSHTIERLHVIQRASAARALGSALACAKDLKALGRVVENTIGGLGVGYCDVCLFVRGSETRAAKLIAHYAGDTPTLAELPYDAGELWRRLPGSLPPHQRMKSSLVFPTANLIHESEAGPPPQYDVLIYPLVFAEEAHGYVVYDAPHSLEDTWLLETIAGHLSSAVNALARDQDLRLAREAAERASAAKSDFVAMMSHEIRTPLNAVLGHLDLCLRTQLTSEQRRHGSRAQAAARTLLEIVNDVLDFSKIEAEKLELEQVSLRLADVLGQVIGACALNATRKGLEFVVDVDPSLPAEFLGDPLRLTQVLINLLSNAIKFSEKGHVVLRIEAAGRDEMGRISLRFEVEDTGIGLGLERLGQIFRPFVQGDSSMSRRYGGTGLGLAISHRLVEMMGGRLTVDSELGRGSTFRFTLPFLSDAEFALPEPFGLGARLLLLEDSAPQAAALKRTLEAHAYVIEWVATAADALRALLTSQQRGTRFDIALLDETVPDADTNLQTLLEQVAHAELSHAMLCAHSTESRHLTGASLGKPADPTSLVELVRGLGRGPKYLAAPRAPELPLARETLLRRHVLLAQDSEVTRELARDLLLSAGAEVTTATNGEEAVRRAAERRPDLILMDLHMPVLDGCEAALAIRALPGCEQLTILSLTASMDAGDLQRCRKAGMAPCPAPADADEFLTAVARAFEAHSNGAIRLMETRVPATASRRVLANELDLESTLARLDGNLEMFRRLLKRFVDSHEQSALEIGRARAAGDLKLAQLLSHTLSGSAAAIGARRLPGVSHAVEAAAKRGDAARVKDLESDLSGALSSTVAAAKQALSTLRTRAPSGTLPAVAVQAAAEHLLRLVKAHDTAAVEAFELLRRLLLTRPNALDRLKDLESRINAYDFEAAKLELTMLGPVLEALERETQHGN